MCSLMRENLDLGSQAPWIVRYGDLLNLSSTSLDDC